MRRFRATSDPAKIHNGLVDHFTRLNVQGTPVMLPGLSSRGVQLKQLQRQGITSFLGRLRVEIIESTIQVPSQNPDDPPTSVDQFTPLVTISGKGPLLDGRTRVLSNWRMKKLMREGDGDNGKECELLPVDEQTRARFDFTFTEFLTYKTAVFELQSNCFRDFDGTDKDGFQVRFALTTFDNRDAAEAFIDPIIPDSNIFIGQFDFVADDSFRKKWKPVIKVRTKSGSSYQTRYYATVPYFWNKPINYSDRFNVWNGYIFTAPELTDLPGKREKYHYGFEIQTGKQHFYLCANFKVKFKVISRAYRNANPPTQYDDECYPIPNEWQYPVRRFYEFIPIGTIIDEVNNITKPFYGAVVAESDGDPISESIAISTNSSVVQNVFLTIPTTIEDSWDDGLTINAKDVETEGENITYGDPDDYYPGWEPGEEYPDPETTQATFIYKMTKTIKVPLFEYHKYGDQYRVEGFAFNVNDVIDHRFEEPRCGRIFEKGLYGTQSLEDPVTFENIDDYKVGVVEPMSSDKIFGSFRHAFPHLKVVPRYQTPNCDRAHPEDGDQYQSTLELRSEIPWWAGGYKIQRAAPLGEWSPDIEFRTHDLNVEWYPVVQCTPVSQGGDGGSGAGSGGSGQEPTTFEQLISESNDDNWRVDTVKPLWNDYPVATLFVSPVDYMSELYATPQTTQVVLTDNYANPEHPLRPPPCSSTDSEPL